MIQWRAGVVESERNRWSGAIEYAVRLSEIDSTVRALAYPELVGEPAVGDRVLLNVSALERGLGTGGLALVVAIPDRLPADSPVGPGHIVKARYTPTQSMLLGVDEQESPHHELLRDADSIDGMPVVVADLHSAVPAIIAGLRAGPADRAEPAGRVGEPPGSSRIETKVPRVAYVMSDGGALPIAFSRTVAGLREAEWLVGSVTVGQAFGGDLEAVNVHTGLLAARHVLQADVVVLSQGPGNLGTGTRWGFSGVAAGEAVNAAATLGGRAVASLRVSEADPRERHRGISHHSRTAYGRVALSPADVPVPTLDGELGALIDRQATELIEQAGGRLTRHDIRIDGLRDALVASPVRLRTMGRDLDADEASFLAAAAAGRYTAMVLARSSTERADSGS
ncbi:DUF3866 family protein [Luteipulveratus mongoliensis]|uniref:DUF3866 domain-containing protein n=1 Tax=Luteipulveratus mongoliensis TaxID=571913 RepID=A0A0K1JK78_9MICO|nr:DUF3866 family protein [Luteipulveratus mongoliensis]AKU16988.1 hypothetical protein VV02_15865 [Luteipulveratus mongoliensis]